MPRSRARRAPPRGPRRARPAPDATCVPRQLRDGRLRASRPTRGASPDRAATAPPVPLKPTGGRRRRRRVRPELEPAVAVGRERSHVPERSVRTAAVPALAQESSSALGRMPVAVVGADADHARPSASQLVVEPARSGRRDRGARPSRGRRRPRSADGEQPLLRALAEVAEEQRRGTRGASTSSTTLASLPRDARRGVGPDHAPARVAERRPADRRRPRPPRRPRARAGRATRSERLAVERAVETVPTRPTDGRRLRRRGRGRSG